jgi:hypothetical protein
MTTFIEFAGELAKHFIRAKNKEDAATHLVYEINTYVKPVTNAKLDDEDKKMLLQLIEDFISGRLNLQLKPGEMIARKEEDHVAFLEIKKYIIAHI